MDRFFKLVERSFVRFCPESHLVSFLSVVGLLEESMERTGIVASDVHVEKAVVQASGGKEMVDKAQSFGFEKGVRPAKLTGHAPTRAPTKRKRRLTKKITWPPIFLP